MVASSQGHEAVVRTLIEAGADVLQADHGGRSALMDASNRGNEAVVRALIEARAAANVNQAHRRYSIDASK